MITRYVFWIIISCLIGTVSFGDSLWKPEQGSLYSVQTRKPQVGDVITILISETTSAVQAARTNTQKQSALTSDFLSDWDQVANLLGNERVRKDYEFQLGGGDRYAGSGETSRSSQVRAVITAIVTEVLDNGNLFAIGEHKVKVNEEVQIIRVSGIIRPEDISDKNSVLSSQLAKAEVSINGAGVVGSKQTPGVVTKMFNWLF